jgi:hypothetical protein
MEVRADITAADHRAFEQLSARPRRGRRVPFWTLVAGWLALTVVFTWLYTATTLKPGYILSAGIGFAVAVVGWAVVLRPNRGDEGAPSLGARTISLDDEGLRVRGEGFELLLAAAASRRVHETAEYVFVVSAHLPVIIVPKRCFASAEDARAFRARLEENHG